MNEILKDPQGEEPRTKVGSSARRCFCELRGGLPLLPDELSRLSPAGIWKTFQTGEGNHRVNSRPAERNYRVPWWCTGVLVRRLASLYESKAVKSDEPLK